MNEIYENYSIQYDELVNHEDYQNNLNNWIGKNLDTLNKSVIEFGTGTGRTTRLYADNAKRILCFDRSDHMLNKCKDNLQKYSAKIRYEIRDNTNFDGINEKADLIIEGWSFGHTIVENKDNIENTTNHIIKNCMNLLNKNGKLVIIETMGSNTRNPKAPSPNLELFYSMLEDNYGFKREIIRTDYQFENWKDAQRVFEFFFGIEAGKGIEESKNCVINEFTGIWHKDNRSN